MLFSMPRRNGGGWNWFKGKKLGSSSIAAGQPLIDHAPKGNYCFSFFIEEVFEELWLIECGRIRISLSIFTEFGNPVTWFLRLDNREKIRGIKKRPARVVQDAQIICFDADYNVWLTKR
jgi:hypothetical protein